MSLYAPTRGPTPPTRMAPESAFLMGWPGVPGGSLLDGAYLVTEKSDNPRFLNGLGCGAEPCGPCAAKAGMDGLGDAASIASQIEVRRQRRLDLAYAIAGSYQVLADELNSQASAWFGTGNIARSAGLLQDLRGLERQWQSLEGALPLTSSQLENGLRLFNETGDSIHLRQDSDMAYAMAAGWVGRAEAEKFAGAMPNDPVYEALRDQAVNTGNEILSRPPDCGLVMRWNPVSAECEPPIVGGADLSWIKWAVLAMVGASVVGALK